MYKGVSPRKFLKLGRLSCKNEAKFNSNKGKNQHPTCEGIQIESIKLEKESEMETQKLH